MKYFTVRYTDDMPEKFGGESSAISIKIRPKYKGDTGLLEHEKTHVRQWYAAAAVGLVLVSLLAVLVSPYALTLALASVNNHGLLYRFVRPYRQWSEVQAYRKQIAVGSYSSNDFAIKALAEKYDLRLDLDEAKRLLLD